MGCDIHAFVEIEEDDGTWTMVDELDLSRNYNLFGLIGEKHRAYMLPVVPLKGIPKDVSRGTAAQLLIMGGDAHSKTWLTVDEARAVCDRYDEEFGRTQDLQSALEDAVHDWGITLRLVIWFDN